MKKSVIVIGLISAGLVIGGTILYFKSTLKKSSSDEENSGGEDIPTPKDTSSTNTQTQTQPQQTPKTSTSTTSTISTTSTATQESPIINDVKSKLGAGARIKNNQVFAIFNKNKNLAIFYSNNRFAIFKVGQESKGNLIKGTYNNGGLTLIPDKGNKIVSNSVWGNLERLPFKK